MFNYILKVWCEKLLNIEEYILQRRTADQIDIEDVSLKTKNLELCLNYVNDYFNLHLVEKAQKEINTALKLSN